MARAGSSLTARWSGPTRLWTTGGAALVVLVLALALALCAAPRRAAATGLNVEAVRLHPQDDGLFGGVLLGVDFQAGNVNRLDLRTSASLALRHGRHVAFLIGSSQYSTRTRASDGKDLSTLLAPESRFVNKAQAHLRYNYELRPWIAGEIFGQLERDQFLLVESRVLFGLGPRFVPVNNGEFSLALGLDYMAEYEALDVERILDPLPAKTTVHRLSSYLSLVYEIEDRVTMTSTTYVQPRFDLLADLRILSQAILDVRLVDPLSLRLSLRLRWDSQPSIYCAKAIALGGCPDASRLELLEVDIAVENSLSVRF